MPNNELQLATLTREPDENLPSWIERINQQLGALAVYWLSEKLVSQARELSRFHARLGKVDPALSTEPGSCYVLAVVKDERLKQVTGSAIVLPVQWSGYATQHDQRLPEGLLRVADQVIHFLSTFPLREPEHPRICLTFPSTSENWPNINHLASRDLDLHWRSAFGTLLLSALSCMFSQSPKEPQWLSVAWDFGPAAVDGLDLKLEVVRRWGGHRFYIPPDAKIESALSDSQHIGILNVKKDSDWRSCFQEALQTLFIPPIAPESWQEFITDSETRKSAINHYHFLASIRRTLADEYHRDFLARGLGVLASESIPGTAKQQLVGRPLVCISAIRGRSDQIATLAWRPSTIMILTDERPRDDNIGAHFVPKSVEDIRSIIEQVEDFNADVRHELIPHKNDFLKGDKTSKEYRKDLANAMNSACNLLRRETGGPIIYDASGGTATMRSIMFSKVLQKGDSVIVLESDRDKPGTENYHWWIYDPKN